MMVAYSLDYWNQQHTHQRQLNSKRWYIEWNEYSKRFSVWELLNGRLVWFGETFPSLVDAFKYIQAKYKIVNPTHA